MRLYEEEARWSILRSEMRTYTQLLASAHRDELVQMIPDYYNYIGDYCFKNNGKIKDRCYYGLYNEKVKDKISVNRCLFPKQ